MYIYTALMAIKTVFVLTVLCIEPVGANCNTVVVFTAHISDAESALLHL